MEFSGGNVASKATVLYVSEIVYSLYKTTPHTDINSLLVRLTSPIILSNDAR